MDLLAESQVEVERLRAGRSTIDSLVDEFRKYPPDMWRTILAELFVALGDESVIEEVFRTRWAFTPSPDTLAFWDKQVEIASAQLLHMCLTLPKEVFEGLSLERQAELVAKGWPKS